MKKNILIVGGAGYVGAVIIEELLRKNLNVVCVDNLTYKNSYSLKSFKNSKNFKFHKISADSNEIKVILKDIDIIIYLAGLVGDPITKKYPQASLWHNENVIKKFINNCVKNEKKNFFIFVSTCSNYGLRKKSEKAKENSTLNPLSLYAKSKVKIEKYLLNIKRKNFHSTILRFSTAFGVSSRMRFDLTVNEFVKDLFLYNEVKVYDENTWRPYCHVKDFARLMLFLIKKSDSLSSNEIYNVGKDQNNFTKKDIAETVKKKIKKGKITYIKGGNDPRNYKVNFSKIEKKLGFKVKYSLNYGINEVINFLKKKKLKKNNFNFKNYGNYRVY